MVNIKLPGVNYDKSVIIAGDLHADWRAINMLIARRKPKIVLQCGDFGWWPRFHKTTFVSSGVWRMDPMHGIKYQAPWNQFGLRVPDAKFYFCPGNHEDWEDLEIKATSDDPHPVEVHKNTFYMPRCSTLTLPDGRVVLFMGGALSTDKAYLKVGFDWFREETITQKDVYNLPETSIDIVVSHTCPVEFKTEIYQHLDDWRNRDSYWLEKFKDPSCYALSHVLEKYEPALWFFGHYHISMSGEFRSCKWTALNKVADAGWWSFLPVKG